MTTNFYKKLLIAASVLLSASVYAAEQPNIVIILADDMGYGDIGAYNKNSKVPTPNLDKLAAQGMRFDDAHTASSVCTPSRYGLLTGRYAWRSKLKKGVTWGYSPLLIEPQLKTLPDHLQDNGYYTAMIGKWHLGLGVNEANFFAPTAEGDAKAKAKFRGLKPGPNEVGFDYFYGIPASLDMQPYVYIENGYPLSTFAGKPIAKSEARRKGGEGFWRAGHIGDDFVHADVLPHLTEKTLAFLQEQQNSEKPFFLYFPLTAPHTPWLPTEKFQGTSGAGHYGDFSVQVDHVVGQVVDKLQAIGKANNTIVIYTSDNGAHWTANDIKKFGHLANGDLRGQKADIHEAGHRVPLIIKWPGRLKANGSSDKQIVLTDLFATIADLLHSPLSTTDKAFMGADSVSFADALLANDSLPRQAPMIHHSVDGMFAIRVGNWKLIEGLGSGGFTPPRRVTSSDGVDYQLYNLQEDPAERHNLAKENPKLVADLLAQLNAARQASFTR